MSARGCQCGGGGMPRRENGEARRAPAAARTCGMSRSAGGAGGGELTMVSSGQDTGHPDSSCAGPSEVMTPALAGSIVDRAAERYFAERRRRVDAFVDRHFSVTGALALHRKALGADMIKAPLNVFLAVPFFAL